MLKKEKIFFWSIGKPWTQLYAEYVVGGSAGIILVEQNEDFSEITAGVYDLTRAFFIGLDPSPNDQGVSTVVVNANATINGPADIIVRSRNISWDFAGSMGPSGLRLYIEIENGTLGRIFNDFTAADGITNAFIRVFGGAVFTFMNSDPFTQPFFNLAAGVNCNFHIQNPSTFVPLLDDNFIGGGAGSAVTMIYEDPSTHDGFLRNSAAGKTPFTTPTINHLIPPGDFNALSVGTALASAATIQPVFPIHVVTGSANIDTIDLPYPNFTGFLRLLSPAGATWQLTAAGNIARAVTPVSGSSIDLTWDPVGALWYPN